MLIVDHLSLVLQMVWVRNHKRHYSHQPTQILITLRWLFPYSRGGGTHNRSQTENVVHLLSGIWVVAVGVPNQIPSVGQSRNSSD